MIQATVVGDDKFQVKIQSMPKQVNSALYTIIKKLALDLKTYVQANKLRNQVLNVKTGNLWRSITDKVTQSGNTTTGIVGTNVPYASVHEYGFDGSEAVKAHTRTISQVFGKQVPSMTINIRSFSRQAKFPERSFLRSSLAEMRSRIQEEMQQAVMKVMK